MPSAVRMSALLVVEKPRYLRQNMNVVRPKYYMACKPTRVTYSPYQQTLPMLMIWSG